VHFSGDLVVSGQVKTSSTPL